MEQKFIKSFFIRSIILLAAVIAVIVVFDPFYQYHKPLPGLKSVLTDKEYQCVGTLRNFDYNALIVGSSVCENYNNRWFDEGFSCQTIKAIRSYGATADLCFLLDIAYQNRDLKYVFYNIDPSSLSADTATTYESTGCPMYLYDTSYLNDYSYVLNKTVLLEKIPYMLAFSMKSDYDEGNSYNWAQWKFFSAELAMGMYNRLSSVKPMYEQTYYEDKLAGNLALLTNQVNSHPETTFKFFFPPYSMLWWDNIYREGDMEAYLYNMEQAMEALLTCENVKLFYFQNDREVIMNLENYMDIIHFSPEINHYICECISSGKNQVSEDNYREIISEMRELSYEIVEKLVKPYEDRIKVDIYDE